MDLIVVVKEIVEAIWQVWRDSSLYVLFGFFVAGLLKAFLKDDLVKRHLGTNGVSSVIKASLIGIPIPLCSCGVLPAAAGIKQQGASKGAVSSFMISTPETGVDSIAISYALLDPVITLFRPIAAFLTAVTTGILINFFDPETKEETGAAPT